MKILYHVHIKQLTRQHSFFLLEDALSLLPSRFLLVIITEQFAIVRKKNTLQPTACVKNKDQTKCFK